MMKTYKINSLKADKYEQDVLPALEREKEQLKNKKISSAKFKEEQKKLYKKYGMIVSEAFSKGRYKTWSSCTQELERYHVLSETKLIPIEKMRALYKAESEWEKEREQMWAGAGEELKKHQVTEDMLTNLNKRIREILGIEDGNWYIFYKRLTFAALDNMDKYGVSYNDAFAIAKIEETHKQRRINILNSRKKNAEKEVEFMTLDDKMTKEIAAAVPSASARWKKVNNARLDYSMKTKYGLTQTQITQFKTAYNKYAIEEYKIISQKKLSDSDKYNQLSLLSDDFCKTVNPLFQAENYKKWYGWWKYDFERKMKRKGLK